MSVLLAREGAVARLLLDRPAKRNALLLEHWLAIPALVAAAGDARVLALASATPGMFCAGADIAELAARGDEPGWPAAFHAAMAAACDALADAPMPVVAAITGDCFGAGVALAMACDLRVATPAARFAVTPAKLGLAYPFTDVRRLVGLIGPGQARRLLLTAAPLDAAEAERIGLVELVTADPEAVVAAVASFSPASLRASKAMVARALAGQAAEDADTRALFEAAFASDAFRAAARAFLRRSGA